MMTFRVSGMTGSLRLGGLIAAAGSILMVVALLAGTADAAPFGREAPGLTVSAQHGATPLFPGAIPCGPKVIVPPVPRPRSPFQPPTWVPSKPPWLR